ncbi:MAG: LapA family protein [Maricaulaceae bacterium]
MKRIRHWIALGLVILLALFLLQNLGLVQITIVFWTFETQRAFMIIATFLLGAAVGWILKTAQRRKHHAQDQT